MKVGAGTLPPYGESVVGKASDGNSDAGRTWRKTVSLSLESPSHGEFLKRAVLESRTIGGFLRNLVCSEEYARGFCRVTFHTRGKGTSAYQDIFTQVFVFFHRLTRLAWPPGSSLRQERQKGKEILAMRRISLSFSDAF